MHAEPTTRLIPLTRGLSAIVDAADYDSLAVFKWHARKSRGTFYAARNSTTGHGRIQIRMHRVILGARPDIEVDHRDLNGLNNTRANLRLATDAQQGQNRTGPTKNTSGFKGVTAHYSGKWRAGIDCDSRHYHLGMFLDPKEAARAYDAAAVRLHGEFARLNFPN